ncbi:glucokinase [Actinorhabdospora filicis]|uniref:Glucokinase n=1 Tax=Actinorhabdospora filicis TaxID=1785913 RepID=A0A9W6SKR0_9ACTN|nr:ROK family protein [Actinorhabdospora filicis]GLZ77700.1 glucokinase [Actinorhabdospora filicis]
MSGLAIGLDVGGTKISGGVITATGEIVAVLPPVVSPAGDTDATVSALLTAVAALREAHPGVTAVGVGAAGMVDWPEGRIRWAPNNAYRDLPLRALLEKETGLTAVVDNDGNTAGWAEHALNPRSGHLLFVTVGTGVGGGLVLDGRLHRGATGIAGEIGHLPVDPHGTAVCGCGLIGCLESLASGTALGRLGREAALEAPDGLLAALAGPGGVTGRTVADAAAAGDATAIGLYGVIGAWLGIGLAGLVTVLDVDRVVIGGGVADAGEPLLGPVRASFEERVFARAHRTPPVIEPASLGNDAGWIGAALLALE